MLDDRIWLLTAPSPHPQLPPRSPTRRQAPRSTKALLALPMAWLGVALCAAVVGCGGKTGSHGRGGSSVADGGGGDGGEANDASATGGATTDSGGVAGAAGDPAGTAGGSAGSGNNGGAASWVSAVPPEFELFQDDNATVVVEEAQPSASECGHPLQSYLLGTADSCLGMPFDCDTDQFPFADGCGCGCIPAYSSEANAAIDVATDGAVIGLPTECHGPNGLLALFPQTVVDMVLVDDAVYVWTNDPHRTEDQLWTIGKESGELVLVTAGTAEFDWQAADQMVTSGGVVSRTADVNDGGDGYVYFVENGEAVDHHDLLRASSTEHGQAQRLASLDFEPFALVVRDSVAYVVGIDGTLWHAAVGSSSARFELVEQLGGYDDDDYPNLIGVDDDAVYWFAGPDLGRTTSDADSLGLYRTCRVAPTP